MTKRIDLPREDTQETVRISRCNIALSLQQFKKAKSAK